MGISPSRHYNDGEVRLVAHIINVASCYQGLEISLSRGCVYQYGLHGRLLLPLEG